MVVFLDASITSEEYNPIVQELADYLSKSEFFAHEFLWDQVGKISALSWWNGLCGKTNLAKIANAILTGPVTSAATERSFKTCSDIHSKKRNRLLVEKARKVSSWFI